MNYKIKASQGEVDTWFEDVFPPPYNYVQKMQCAQVFTDTATQIELTPDIEVSTAIVRPLNLGIEPIVNNNSISFELPPGKKVSVEINGGIENNIVVYSERTRFITPRTNEILFKKGIIYNEPVYDISQNDTNIIIERGACIKGKLLVHDCSNVTISGWGKISMAEYDWDIRPVERRRALEVINCKNVNVFDVTISDSVDWSLRIMGSDDVLVDNVKIVGHRGNSDGVDVCGSRNVEVSNVFTRVWDDSNVSKALGTGNQQNVTFHDNVMWNDFARPIEVGVEGRADVIENITFRDIDVIHSLSGYPIMGVHHGDHAHVRNILFENIRIEDAPGAEIFDAYVKHTAWNRDDVTGDIDGVTIRNISCLDGSTISNPRILGMDNEHTIKNITFENINLGGYSPKSVREMGIEINDFVSDINFVDAPKGYCDDIVNSSIVLRDIKHNNGIYSCVAELLFTNEGRQFFNGSASLKLNPVNLAKYDDSAFELSIPPGETVKKMITVELQAGKYLFNVASSNPKLKRSWLYKDFCLSLHVGSVATFEFCNYYGYRAPITINPCDEGLNIKCELSDVVIYACNPVKMLPGQALFSVEETDFGEALAIINGESGNEATAILRNPLEITYVFKNEPKVKEIRRVALKNGFVSYKELGVEKYNFWLEIVAVADETKNNRYPLSLFHSVKPELTAHMFGNIFIGDS